MRLRKRSRACSFKSQTRPNEIMRVPEGVPSFARQYLLPSRSDYEPDSLRRPDGSANVGATERSRLYWPRSWATATMRGKIGVDKVAEAAQTESVCFGTRRTCFAVESG